MVIFNSIVSLSISSNIFVQKSFLLSNMWLPWSKFCEGKAHECPILSIYLPLFRMSCLSIIFQRWLVYIKKVYPYELMDSNMHDVFLSIEVIRFYAQIV